MNLRFKTLIEAQNYLAASKANQPVRAKDFGSVEPFRIVDGVMHVVPGYLKAKYEICVLKVKRPRK